MDKPRRRWQRLSAAWTASRRRCLRPCRVHSKAALPLAPAACCTSMSQLSCRSPHSLHGAAQAQMLLLSRHGASIPCLDPFDPGLPASRPPGLPASRPPGLPASRPPGLPASRHGAWCRAPLVSLERIRRIVAYRATCPCQAREESGRTKSRNKVIGEQRGWKRGRNNGGGRKEGEERREERRTRNETLNLCKPVRHEGYEAWGG